jgi:hypothetical protein
LSILVFGGVDEVGRVCEIHFVKTFPKPRKYFAKYLENQNVSFC